LLIYRKELRTYSTPVILNSNNISVPKFDYNFNKIACIALGGRRLNFA